MNSDQGKAIKLLREVAHAAHGGARNGAGDRMLIIDAAKLREIQKVVRICIVCGGDLEPYDEGPECDETGCPARYGDG